jgi:hypothetical protein
MSKGANPEKQARRPAALLTSAASLPIRMFLRLLESSYRIAAPYTPQLAPLVVFTLLLPIIAFFSAVAGWAVWRSVSVSWEIPLYLQYGLVQYFLKRERGILKSSQVMEPSHTQVP